MLLVRIALNKHLAGAGDQLVYLAFDMRLRRHFRSTTARTGQARGSPEQATDQWALLVHFAALRAEMYAIPLRESSVMFGLAFYGES